MTACLLSDQNTAQRANIGKIIWGIDVLLFITVVNNKTFIATVMDFSHDKVIII